MKKFEDSELTEDLLWTSIMMVPVVIYMCVILRMSLEITKLADSDIPRDENDLVPC